ncbi:beta-lactamase family protein [Planomonospora sp. ID67723]|uniref:serine hydrolase domain-containing protein n=1 Tax=Planomonospora sp. ID67723 TaxID=2738134 RepID=UPI0018C3E174|nr:serine hydrolase domain-containing protein [Planomonospora sp. ID67723]MBG0831727.1 beta-lactamase family protein [Planomonospora sp. ID67723]
MILLSGLSAPAAMAGSTGPVHDGSFDSGRVQAFLDRRVPQLLREQKVPGAAVSVVDSAGEIFTGGYGYADLAAGKPVVADTTAFQTASIAKTFTAVAVMQLAETEKLDLDADVNGYLPEKAKLPDTHPGRPVTLRHLLTHTAGFAEITEGTAAPSAERVSALGDYIVRYQPARIHPPGRFVAYSNYGIDLAGYIVQTVSGRSFEDYMTQRVFAPLRMTRTAFMQLDEARRRLSAPVPYEIIDGENRPVPLWYANGAPSGGSYATVTDMGRFLRALLNGGELDGRRVLTSTSVKAMLRRQAGPQPELRGPGFGTFQGKGTGPQWAWHTGDESGAHAEYALVPERGVGIYIAVNGDGVAPDKLSGVRDVVIREFLTTFAGVKPYPVPASPAAPGRDLDSYTGEYLATRMSEGEAYELFLSAADRVTVTALGDGTLHTSHPVLPDRVWIPAGGETFVSADGTDRLGFIKEEGKIVGLSSDGNPTQNYERISWYASPMVLLPTAAGALLVLLGALAWPVAALGRRLRGRATPPTGRAAWQAQVPAVATALICLGYLGFLTRAASDLASLSTGTALPFSLVWVLPTTVTVVALAALSWSRGWWSKAARVRYSAVAAGAVVFLTIAARYGLM